MYAIVKTGGKQYRVEEGQSLLVERLPVDDGGKAVLQPLLYVDGSNVVDGDELSKVTVEARVLAHERGPKLRIVKFKPKRGYKRRTGHRQELTRIEVTGIKLGARRSPSRAKAADTEAAAQPAPVAAEATPAVETKPAAEAKPTAETKPAARRAPAPKPAADAKPAAEKPARKPAARKKPSTPKPNPEEDNGA
jgi:large subunit ribosomal protein L21